MSRLVGYLAGLKSEIVKICHSEAHMTEPHHEKTKVSICENKDADQLRGNHEADQRLCFRYIASTIPLISKSEI